MDLDSLYHDKKQQEFYHQELKTQIWGQQLLLCNPTTEEEKQRLFAYKPPFLNWYHIAALRHDILSLTAMIMIDYDGWGNPETEEGSIRGMQSLIAECRSYMVDTLLVWPHLQYLSSAQVFFTGNKNSALDQLIEDDKGLEAFMIGIMQKDDLATAFPFWPTLYGCPVTASAEDQEAIKQEWLLQQSMGATQALSQWLQGEKEPTASCALWAMLATPSLTDFYAHKREASYSEEEAQKQAQEAAYQAWATLDYLNQVYPTCLDGGTACSIRALSQIIDKAMDLLHSPMPVA